MMGYLFGKREKANDFASFYDFITEYLTPEGFQLFAHVNGWLPDYYNPPDARSIVELLFMYARFKNFARPDSGLSAITRALEQSATELGAKLYKNEKIKFMEEYHEDQFKLMTTNYAVSVKKLVLAVPPQPMNEIKGSVAEKIKNDSIFQSVGIFEAFKGFAVFEEAWWQYNSTGSRYLADEQRMVSTSDCLGSIFPYK